jgi:hypothetical protein
VLQKEGKKKRKKKKKTRLTSYVNWSYTKKFLKYDIDESAAVRYTLIFPGIMDSIQYGTRLSASWHNANASRKKKKEKENRLEKFLLPRVLTFLLVFSSNSLVRQPFARIRHQSGHVLHRIGQINFLRNYEPYTRYFWWNECAPRFSDKIFITSETRARVRESILTTAVRVHKTRL